MRMRRLIAMRIGKWLSGLMSRGRNGREQPNSPQAAAQEFMALVVVVASSMDEIARVVPLEEEFSLQMWRHGSDEPMVAYLGNMFSELHELPPEEREEALRNIFAGLFHERPETWEDAEPLLLPVVRAETMFLHTRKPGDDTPPSLQRPFVPFFCESVVIDADASMAYVPKDRGSDWGVSEDEIFARATENLATLDPCVEPYDDRASSPLWHVATGDDYESSRLLLPGWLADFEGKVEGRPVAIVPCRNLLIVGGAGDNQLLARMMDIVQRETRAGARPLSGDTYTVDRTGRVVPLDLPRGHPFEGSLRAARRLFLAGEYNDQREVLEPLLEAEGKDIYVGQVSVMELKGGDELSYCVWGQGVECLLPEADAIVFSIGSDPKQARHVVVLWDTAIDVLGSCLEPDIGYGATRYRTRAWPNDEQLNTLERAALTVLD